MHAGPSYLSSAPRLQVPKGFEQEGASLIKKGGPTIKVCRSRGASFLLIIRGPRMGQLDR